MTTTRQKQQDIIKADLLAGKPVDSVSAFHKGITRLSAYIYRLRLRGWPIIIHQDKGNGLAHYRLADGWQPGIKKPR